jgi:C1A family cysteine protease
MATNKRKFGWIKDSLDPRDLHFAALMPVAKIIEFPSLVDLEAQCSPVEDQGELGSCTANALVGALEFLAIRQESELVEDFSRLFLYYNERVIENSVCSDAGAELRDGIKSLVSTGICDEKLWEYDVSKFAKKPPKKCYNDALKHRIIKYFKIASLDGMRQCLTMGYPFVFGFAVFESFDSIGKDGIMPIPNPDAEELMGGHAVMCCGFDEERRLMKVRNSWGSSWGKRGYFFMPYEFIADKRFCSDFWMIQKEM